MVRDATWQLVSHRPLLYHCSDFMTPGECDAILQMASLSLSSLIKEEQQLFRGRRKRRADLEASDERLSPEDAALLRRLDQRLAALTGLRTHAGELPWAVHVTNPSELLGEGEAEAEGASRRMAMGLHVDTNNERERRWLTFIAYLRTTPAVAGGHTVFPLAVRPDDPPAGGAAGGAGQADAERLVAAAERLLGLGLQHTGRPGATLLPWRPEGAGGDAEDLLRHADRVASAAALAAAHGPLEAGTPGLHWDSSGLGLAVPVEKGSCVAFFTRSEASAGGVDPHSWHGGAAIELGRCEGDGQDVGKWTLQRFREAPVEADDSASIQAFALQHADLRPCCGGGVRFDVATQACEA